MGLHKNREIANFPMPLGIWPREGASSRGFKRTLSNFESDPNWLPQRRVVSGFLVARSSQLMMYCSTSPALKRPRVCGALAHASEQLKVRDPCELSFIRPGRVATPSPDTPASHLRSLKRQQTSHSPERILSLGFFFVPADTSKFSQRCCSGRDCLAFRGHTLFCSAATGSIVAIARCFLLAAKPGRAFGAVLGRKCVACLLAT